MDHPLLYADRKIIWALGIIGLVYMLLGMRFMPIKEAARACLVPKEFYAEEFDYHWDYAHNLAKSDPRLYHLTIYPHLWREARWYQITHPIGWRAPLWSEL